jgi:hypothetical protein
MPTRRSRFEPAVLVDLNSRAERERLSKAALTGFFKLAASLAAARRRCARTAGRPVALASTTGRKPGPGARSRPHHAHLLPARHLQGAAHPVWRQARRRMGASPQQQHHLRRTHAALAACWPAACWPCRRYASCSTRAAEACDLGGRSQTDGLRQFDTCRLIPSRFADLEDSVLAPLATTTPPCATCSTSITPPTSACAANRACCPASGWTNWCSACRIFASLTRPIPMRVRKAAASTTARAAPGTAPSMPPRRWPR